MYYQTEFGTAIFEEVADVCYNMLDHLEQYKQYLESMKLIHVPLHVKATASSLSTIPTATADQLPGSQSTTATQGQYDTVRTWYGNWMKISKMCENFNACCRCISTCISEDVTRLF